jgi:protein-disulfide isomerase
MAVMRSSICRLLLVVAVVCVAGGAVFAQDDGDEPVDRYPDIPRSRGEDGAFVLGDPDALITVMEFSDFLCPACQRYEPIVLDFIEEFVTSGQARFEYRLFPIINETFSPLMSELVECAGEQDMFWSAHELMFGLASAGLVDAGITLVAAERLGLDHDDLLACMEDAEQFITDYQLGLDLRVTGTPAIRVRVGDGDPGAIALGGRAYDAGGVPLEVLREFIESENPAANVIIPGQLRNPRLLQDTSLVTGDPCAAPCWRDITPGVTAWADALEMLNADPQFVNLSTREDPASSQALISWGQADGDNCCQMATTDGETVAYLILQTTPDMLLGDVLETYDEPDFLIGEIVDSRQGLMILFFREVPMLVYVFVAGELGELSQGSEVIGVAYLTPRLIEDIISQSELFAWQGYQSFIDYVESDLAVTPEP